MKTSLTLMLLIFLNFGLKAQEVDSLETSKRKFPTKSSIGIGFWNFGSLASIIYERNIYRSFSLRLNIGTNSFLNGNSTGISIGFLPELKVLNFKNKLYISVNSGILYSKSFESEYVNSRSFNNLNMGNYEKGGQTPTFQNHIAFIASLNLITKMSHRFFYGSNWLFLLL